MRKRNSEQGAALMFALVVIGVLGIGTSVLWSQLHQNLKQHRITWHKEQAFQLAEGGLHTACAALQQTGGAYRGESETPLGEGTFTVVVAPQDKPGDYEITSTGQLSTTVHADRFTLHATLTMTDGGRVTNLQWQPLRDGGVR